MSSKQTHTHIKLLILINAYCLVILFPALTPCWGGVTVVQGDEEHPHKRCDIAKECKYRFLTQIQQIASLCYQRLCSGAVFNSDCPRTVMEEPLQRRLWWVEAAGQRRLWRAEAAGHSVSDTSVKLKAGWSRHMIHSEEWRLDEDGDWKLRIRFLSLLSYCFFK